MKNPKKSKKTIYKGFLAVRNWGAFSSFSFKYFINQYSTKDQRTFSSIKSNPSSFLCKDSPNKGIVGQPDNSISNSYNPNGNMLSKIYV